VVEAIAVELDGEPPLGPSAVDAASARRAVRARQRKSLLAQPLEEPPLEDAERDERVAVHDLPQLRRAGGSRPAREHRGDLPRGRPEADAGLVTRAREVVEHQDRGQVGERAGHRGDRDAAVDRAIRRVDQSAPHRDARDPPLERRRHLGGRDRPLEEPEQVRGRAAAQPRLAPACEDRGQVPRLDARRAVADAVDAAVHAKQRAGAEAVADLVRRDAGAEQLRPGHHPVLLRREVCEHRGRSGAHMTP
jgi:hypothetical protein